LLAFYYVVTTITTVGYGDITAVTKVEYVFAVVMLFAGVISFSFSAGSLSSIITSYDTV
jgi:voltage-gated potassium channel